MNAKYLAHYSYFQNGDSEDVRYTWAWSDCDESLEEFVSSIIRMNGNNFDRFYGVYGASTIEDVEFPST